MNIPADILDAVVKAAGKELADRAATGIDDLRLVPIRTAAEMLGVSEPKCRALIREYVELGEASRRVRLSTIRQLIEARTIPCGMVPTY